MEDPGLACALVHEECHPSLVRIGASTAHESRMEIPGVAPADRSFLSWGYPQVFTDGRCGKICPLGGCSDMSRETSRA
jgi:hypothetical protein